jgi:hypothetical protein
VRGRSTGAVEDASEDGAGENTVGRTKPPELLSLESMGDERSIAHSSDSRSEVTDAVAQIDADRGLMFVMIRRTDRRK